MEKSLEILKKSGVILTPTDTTFGLSCLASDIKAIQRINKIKQRPEHKNYILLVATEAQLQELVEVPDLAWDIIDLSEKPVTIVYDNILNLPKHLISERNTIAIRLIKSSVLQKLIQKLREPLISTSVNVAGTKTPKTFSEISPKIIEQIDYIIPETEKFQPKFSASSIIEISSDAQVKVIRE